jgi:hypothetical protein
MSAVNWKNPVNGNWTVAADWSTGTVPGATDDATLGLTNGYTVSITSPITVGSIAVSNAAATLSVNDPSQIATVAGDLLDGGALVVDNSGGEGGTNLSIGGTLGSSDFVDIGNGSLSAPTLVNANALTDTGTLHIFGGATNQAALDIAAAAGFGVTGVLTGTLSMSGNALLQFGGGQIMTIADNASLTLDGPQAFVARSGSTGSNSALSGLIENAGTISLQDGAFVAVSGNLDNAGTLNVDNGSNDSGSGLTVADALTNMGFLGIGDSALTSPDTVTIGGLLNSGTIAISGNANTGKAGTLDVLAAAGLGEPGLLSGNVNLSGDALLEFANSDITTISSRGELTISGPHAFVADSGSTGSNSALLSLADNAGTLSLQDGAAVNISGNLNNSGAINVDSSSDGGSGLSITDTLTNVGSLGIGDGSLSAPVTVTIGGLLNSGAIAISGNATTGKAGTLDVTAAAGFGEPGLLSGNVNLSGDALLEFANSDITSISSSGELTINGPQAFVADSGSAGSNSALTLLADNAGTLSLQNGAAVSISGNLNNSGTINVDNSGNGGSSLSVADTLTNTGSLSIGDGTLTSPDTVMIGGLLNSGAIAISGNASTSKAGTLDVDATAGFGAPELLTGNVNLSGDALLEFTGGEITTIANNAQLVLNSARAFVADPSDTGSNSALTSLADNAGTLDLGDGAFIDVGGDFENTGNINVDGFGDDQGSGSGLTVTDTLTNTDFLGIGDNSLTSSDTVTAAALINAGTIDITGNSNNGIRATLTVNGLASNADNLTIAAAGNLNVTGGNTFIQTAGTTKVTGALAAATVDLVGGTLEGTGTVTGNIDNTGGTVFGGTSSPGTLTLDGNYTQTAGGVFQAFIIGTSASQIAAVNISGDVDLQGGVLDFNLGNFTPTLGDSFTLMTFAPGDLSGTFGTIEVSGGFVGSGSSVNIRGGLSLAVSYNNSAGTITAHVVNASPANSWTGSGTANWSTASDWSTGAVPGSSDNAVLGGTTSYTVSIAAPITATAALDVSDTNATLSVLDTATTLTDGDLTNVGQVDIDASGNGGSTITVDGTLRNGGNLNIGNTGITSSVSVTAAGLANLPSTSSLTGIINLAGSTALGSADQALLAILAAAPGTLVGDVNLTGDALLQFASGAISAIGGGSELTLNGDAAQVGIAGASGNALNTVADNAGTLNLTAGASITTNAGTNFDNTGGIDLDTFLNPGGSSLTIGGVLTNSGQVQIGALGEFQFGANGIISPDTITAAGLDNSGSIEILGSTAPVSPSEALLNILAAAPSTLTGTYTLAGNALLQFSSGAITAIGGNSGLSLNGALAQVLISGDNANNNALDTLDQNDGNLTLVNGASVTTDPGINFYNTGSLDLDNFLNHGGSTLTFGGVLTNSGEIQIGPGAGDGTITASDTVTAQGLDNLVSQNAGIDLDGNDASGSTAQAVLNILSAAPTTLTGSFDLTENSLLQFASGGITAIAVNSTLAITGTASYVAISGNVGTNSALDTLAANYGNLELSAGASITTNPGVDFDNTGSIRLDFGTGGSSLTIGGELTNTGNIDIGNSGITSSVVVTAQGLNNDAAIAIAGNTTAGTTDQALLNILAAAPTILTGSYNLTGDALLQFASGAITTIGTGSVFSLSGSAAQVAISGNTANNNALDNLAENDGTLQLNHGATITTNSGVNFDNTGTVTIGSGDNNSGGSALTIGGVLTNSGNLSLGNSGLVSSDTVTAQGLVNLAATNAEIDLTGSTKTNTGKAVLNILSAAPTALTGTYNLSGYALLQFASGGIVSIDGNSTLAIDGSAPQLAISSNAGNNNALDTLAENDGTLNLTDGATIATNAGLDFANTGTLEVDAFGIGGGGFNVGGVLRNTGSVQLGNDGGARATSAGAGGLDNTGTFNLNDGTLSLGSALDNAGQLNIGDNGIFLPTEIIAVTLNNIESGTIALSGTSSSSASLTITGLATNAANLQINSGSVAEVGSLDNTGTITLSGNAGTPSSFGVIGSATNDGTITVGDFSEMGVGGSFDDAGSLSVAGTLDIADPLTVEATETLTMQGGSIIDPSGGELIVASGASVTGTGTIAVPIENDATITASGGLLDISGAITGVGQLTIAAGSDLELSGVTAQTVSFGGNVGTLKLDDPASFTGAITGLVEGDTIDLAGVQATSAVVNGSTLTVTAGAQTFTYQVAGAGLSGNVFAIENDQQDGSNLVLSPPGPVIDSPNAQTVFTGLPAVLGPLTIADPTAGNGTLTLRVSDTAGLLSAVPAGAGTVAGSGTNSLTLTGDLTDLDAMLASLIYARASAGSENVDVEVMDAGSHMASLDIAVATETVPFTEPVLNAPAQVNLIAGTPTAIGGLSFSDPYASDTGQQLITKFLSNPTTFEITGPTGPTITGQSTDSLTVVGTVNQINTDLADPILAEWLGVTEEQLAILQQGGITSNFLTEQYAAAAVSGGAGDSFFITLTNLFDSFVAELGGVEAAVARLTEALAAGGGTNLITFGGLTYDINLAGEFILALSTQPGDSFQVQVRLQPLNNSQAASAITQIAALVGSDRVTFGVVGDGLAAPVLVDGNPPALTQTNPVSLSGGTLTQLSAGTYEISWNSGETLTVTDYGAYLNLKIGLPSDAAPGSIEGLIGPNGEPQADAFELPDGTILAQPLTTNELYQTFAQAWLVPAGFSLFDYASGQSPGSFNNPNFPAAQISLAELQASVPSAVAAAAAVVAAAGITDPNAAAAAEFDYLASGGNLGIVESDANFFQGVSTTAVGITPGGSTPAVLGVMPEAPTIDESQTGVTPITFDIYLTAPLSSSTEVDYSVIAPNATDLGASAFGGTLPSSEVTLAANATGGQFTIDVPQGALGSVASGTLAVQISTPSGIPIFAPDAQATLLAPQPGTPPVAELVYLTSLGNLIRNGNDYTLDLGAVELGEPLPTLQFAIENAASAPSDQLTGTIEWSTVAGFSIDVDGTTTSGVGLPSPIAAGQSFDGLTANVDQDKFGDNSETITFNPVDTNASGFSAPLTPITLTITDTLELPGMVYSQAWGDVHIITYNGLTYNFQDTGDFVLAESRIPGDDFEIQMALAPPFPGDSVTTIHAVAIALGADRVTFDWSRASTVLVDGGTTTLSMADPTLTLTGGTVTEISPSVYKVDWNTGETMTLTDGSYINIIDGIPGNASPGAYGGLQGENEGTQNDFQLADGQILPQPLTTAELYGEYADSWAVTQATSLFDTPVVAPSAPADPLTLADLPTAVVTHAAQLVAAAGITDPGIAQAAELDYIATGNPNFITASADIQQQITSTTPANVAPSTPATAAVGVEATATSVVESSSGSTAVTFTAYLTATETTDTTIDYAVVTPSAGFLGASAFGGTLPSGSVTIAAGQTTTQFTIEVPQGALGTDPSDILQVQVSDPDSIPVFAPTAQTEIVNNQPEPGNPAQPILAEITGNGTLTFDAATDTYTLNFGGLTEGNALQAAQLAIVNAATIPADNLAGTFTAPTGTGFFITGNSLSSPLAPEQSYQGLYVTVNASVTGTHTMTMTFDPSDVNDSGYSAALSPITLDIVDSVTAPAVPQINTPTTIIFPNVHVGGIDSQKVSVTNTAAAGAGSLDVTLTPSGNATSNGTITALAPGATDASDLSVGLDTSTAGALGGSVTENFVSDPDGNDTPISEADPYIDVFGSAYRLAGPSVIPSNITVHVGASGTQTITITITNIDPNDGYSENLIATVVGTTGAVTASGTTGDIDPQSDGTITATFSTTTPGQIGTITLDLKSDGTGIDGLGVTDLGDVTIPVAVTSDNVPAAAQFEEISGGGTFTHNGSAYAIDLGTITAATTINFGVLNNATVPADDLGGTFTTSGPSGFTVSGLGAFSGIASGSADTAPMVTLYTGVAGTFTETITLDPTDTTTNTALPDETLTIDGTVATATPPTIMAPSSIVVQQGVAFAIIGVSITDPDTGATVTASLSDGAGLLAASTNATGGGGTITGSGTGFLEIVGTLAQVNADLTTLTDTDSTLAADSIMVGASDSIGAVATSATIAVAVNAPPVIMVPPSPVLVQQGQAFNITPVSISDADAVSAGETITVTLADANGLLSANTGTTGGGGMISNPGTTDLTISGTLAQVNADLTTLSDTDSTLAADSIAVNASDGRGGNAVQKTITIDVNAPPVITAPPSVSVDQNLGSPVAGVSISDPDAVSGNETLTVTLTDTDGLLSANIGATAGGGMINNSGSTDVTIIGTLAQVNADLTTLSDVDSSLSPDSIVVNADDGRGGTAMAKSIAVSVGAASASATISLINGNDTINSSYSYYPALGPYQVVPTLVTVPGGNVTAVNLSGDASGFSPGDTFPVTVTDGYFAEIYIATIGSSGDSWAANLPASDIAQLPNGTATVAAHNDSGLLLATQSVTVEGSAAPANNGNLTISPNAELEIFGAYAATASFASTAGGSLKLDSSTQFTGRIMGFGGQDLIDLSDIAFGPSTTLGYSENNAGTGGTLTVSNGTGTPTANLVLLGNYTAASFAKSTDGHTGTLISDPPLAAGQNSLLSQAHH